MGPLFSPVLGYRIAHAGRWCLEGAWNEELKRQANLWAEFMLAAHLKGQCTQHLRLLLSNLQPLINMFNGEDIYLNAKMTLMLAFYSYNNGTKTEHSQGRCKVTKGGDSEVHDVRVLLIKRSIRDESIVQEHPPCRSVFSRILAGPLADSPLSGA